MKKGQVGVQFNWILVVIAGALIFLFFFSIIRWAQQNSELSNANTVTVYLDSIMTGAAVTKDTITQKTLPYSRIDLTCENYRVNNNANMKSIKNKIIFSPGRLEKGNLILWSLGWNAPMRVTNFLLLSSPDIKYVFMGDENDDLFSYIKDAWPEEFNAEFNPPTIKNRNNFKIRFISVNRAFQRAPVFLSVFKGMSAKDVTALDIDSTGKADFYVKSPVGVAPEFNFLGSSEFSGDASLFATIISDTKEDYDCNMRKAFSRLGYISRIYLKKAESLYTYYVLEGDLSCETVYSGYWNWALNDLRNGQPNYFKLSEAQVELEDKNIRAQEQSCALLY